MKMETVVVTGGSGYIGTEVVSQLVRGQFNVIVIDVVPPIIKNKRVTFYKHDLTRQISPRKIPTKAHYVIHLAAKAGGIAFANTYPASILRSNLLIDLYAITFAKEINAKRFLYASSSLVYEKDKKIPYRETHRDLQTPSLAYGLAKLVGEKNCEAFHKEYGLPFTICRLFNVYGVNSLSRTDPHSHVIPDLMQKVLSKQYPLTLYGNGNQTRNFTHVKDTASGIIAALLHPKAANEIFNIAGNREISIKEIAQTLWQITGQRRELIFTCGNQYNYDVGRSYADIKKIKSMIGWSPKIRFRQGLREMVEHYRKINASFSEQS